MKTSSSKSASLLLAASAMMLLSACAITSQPSAQMCPRSPVIPASVMVPRSPDFVSRMETLLYGLPAKPTPSPSSSGQPKQSSPD